MPPEFIAKPSPQGSGQLQLRPEFCGGAFQHRPGLYASRVPSSAKADSDIVKLDEQTMPNNTATLKGWSLTVESKKPEAGYQNDSDYIVMQNDETIVFQMKGKISPKKDEISKLEAKNYTIHIAEYYADVEDEPQETLSDVVVLSRE
ncbi:hypothetical protein CJF32_00009871 [Rutstroemia sp. NJR-2017a WRK4]|nr:hypothetical protein CJF32_00009871 [Rutstroemia sp. NJR-2017a WRK4]